MGLSLLQLCSSCLFSNAQRCSPQVSHACAERVGSIKAKPLKTTKLSLYQWQIEINMRINVKASGASYRFDFFDNESGIAKATIT